MKIKSVVTNRIQTRHTSFQVDLHLENNITFLGGDSGTGRSTMFSFFKELSAEDKRIKCFNYLDWNKSYKSSIKRSKGKLIIIDNADILLDDAMRSYIALDGNNQYIIIGRNPTGLLLNIDEVYELQNENVDGITLFTLKKSF